MKTQVKADMSISSGWDKCAIAVPSQKRGRFPIDKHGFTLVELIVVCAILGILATFAVPAFSELRSKAKTGRCTGEIRGLEKDIIAFATENGRYPDDLGKINRTNLKDPWGRDYVYAVGGGYLDIDGVTNLNSDFDLYSLGEDGDTDQDLSLPSPSKSLDDVVRGGDGAEVALGELY